MNPDYYTPLLCNDEKTIDIDDSEYESSLPFDNDEYIIDEKHEEDMEENDVIDACDPFHIVDNEWDVEISGVRSLVSMTHKLNDSEKVLHRHCYL